MIEKNEVKNKKIEIKKVYNPCCNLTTNLKIEMCRDDNLQQNASSTPVKKGSKIADCLIGMGELVNSLSSERRNASKMSRTQILGPLRGFIQYSNL